MAYHTEMLVAEEDEEAVAEEENENESEKVRRGEILLVNHFEDKGVLDTRIPPSEYKDHCNAYIQAT